MKKPPWIRSVRRALLAAGATAALAAGLLTATATTSQAATQGPCDIYAAGGTPCVAAHSTTRALYAAYNGPLYQVRRASDNTTKDIGLLSAGGYANAAAQDSFCAGTSCVITVIYDQSGQGNNLTQAPAGGAAGGPDNLANATAAPVTVGGHKAYGVYVAPGTGYRNNNTNGIATGDQPEGMYAIFDGTHYNGGCCFDYGNAETNSNDTGNGHMEAIYFGNIKVWGSGSGNGPWVMADLENGLFSGVNPAFNAGDPTVNNRFLTAIVKGGPNQWAIRGGNAQSGGLSTFYSGVRPNVSGYNPMHKEGAIILGIGGDNSKGAAGHLLRRCHDLRLPLGRHRERRAGQHHRRRLQQRLDRHRLTDPRLPHLPAGHHGPCCTSRLPAPQRRRHQGRHLQHQLLQLGHRQGRRHLDRPRRPGQQLLRLLRVRQQPRPVPTPLQLPALPATPTTAARSFAQDATFCPTAGNSGQGYFLPVRQLPHQVHPPLQLHRLPRQQRRLQRLGLHDVVGRGHQLAHRISLELTGNRPL